MTHPEEYAEAVMSGDILTGQLIRLTVERHRKDLKRKRGIYFDEAEGLFICQFFEDWLTHFKGIHAGNPFILEPWQKFMLYLLNGWKSTDGRRRFQTLYLEVAKKNGKTPLAAGISLFSLLADNEPGAEVYYSATTRDQAKICFKYAAEMVKRSPEFSERIRVLTNALAYDQQTSTAQPVSSEAGNIEGKSGSCIIVDEFHEHKTPEVRNNLRSGMASRWQPLEIITTTAGYNKNGPCFAMRKTCIDVLKGRKKNDALLPMIFTIDEGDDWTDQKNWHKSNPNLGVSVQLSYLQNQFTAAKTEGSTSIVAFQTKHMNIWTDAPNEWIGQEVWKKNDRGAVDLSGRACAGGLDLSSTSDITALVLYFEDENEQAALECFFWVPEETAKAVAKDGQIPYLEWVNDGHLLTTPGNVIDKSAIRRMITGTYFEDGAQKYDPDNIMERYQVKAIAYDPWQAATIVPELIQDGAPMTKHPQGIGTMSGPTKELEKRIMAGTINHQGQPVLDWMRGNVAIYTDANGNIKVHKKNSSGKVDGIIATIMALNQFHTPDETVKEKWPSDWEAYFE